MAYAIADSKHRMCESRCKTLVKLEAIAWHKAFRLRPDGFRYHNSVAFAENSCLHLYSDL